MTKILLVDDEEKILNGFSRALTSFGHVVSTTSSGNQALDMLREDDIDLVLTDLVMPEMDGITLLGKISKKHPGVPVIIITGHGTVETAVQSMKEGAFDYITKPFNLDEVEVIIGRAMEHKKLLEENLALKNQIRREYHFDSIIGNSSAFQEVYRVMDKVKDTKSTVLITGQSGTGKELIAKAIHYNGALQDQAFVAVDCASIAENLLESEMFGHVKGSFTGAHKDKKGYFETANNGTIFLDEIGEFSQGLQSRLLRVLQEKEISRVGESTTRKVDVRVIAATNRDLEQMVKEGHFREDLFYRLNVITIHVPPLVDRLEDIPVLVNHFIQKLNDKIGKEIQAASDNFLSLLANYSWPGNVRELENTMERVMTFCDDPVIQLKHVPDPLKRQIEKQKTEDLVKLVSHTYKEAKQQVLQQFNRDYILTILDKCDNNVSKAARASDMDRGCFYRLMRKYDIQQDDESE